MNTISEFLMEHKAERPISFHMPGHKGRTEIFDRYGFRDFARDMVGNDITEIPGADALTQPQGSIRRVMENYAALYGVRHTELLVNGSSAGLIASILATVPRGGKLILGRNSHKSVFSALRMGDVRPVYVKPSAYTGYDLQGAVTAEAVRDAIRENPDASAVLITSPNYYGVLSKIDEIALEAHDAGMVLIVDQAHGAHLKFFDETSKWPSAAENLRADIVVNSTHKTLLSFTGSAILNICTERVNQEAISEWLRMIQTTSPSYLLMGSLDVNERVVAAHRSELIATWKDDLRYFYSAAKNIVGLQVIEGRNFDLTKINISMKELGVDGHRLEETLREQNIWAEMVHGDYVMLMTGIGNQRSDYETLLDALEAVSNKYGVSGEEYSLIDPMVSFDLTLESIPMEKERIPIFDAEGRVAYDAIVPYPPGVPIVCPGEIISYEVIAYLQQRIRFGETVLGVDEEGTILVGKDDF